MNSIKNFFNSFSPTLTFLLRGGASETGIVVPGSSIFGGFSLTWLLAIFGTYVSFPLGVLLALGRNSKLPIVRIICTGIIELVRSVPYITWLFFASVTLAVFLITHLTSLSYALPGSTSSSSPRPKISQKKPRPKSCKNTA